MQTINFQGTLFRFPLREHKSDISKNVYDNAKANELLSSFSDDASLMLLFLKNIETVKVFTIDSDSKKTLKISAVLSDDTADHVRTARRRICDAVKTNWKHRQKKDLAESYKMTIDVCSSDITKEKRNWFVCTYICWPQDVETQMTSKEEGLSAWVGVAMSLDSVDVKGRTFCFLPLPPEESATCLPVHVNGAFAVSPDRRSIKWPSEDRIEDNSALWNKYL
ncbi:sacsin-like, partial [Anneissia japonica]|uniref:sacsin-like n=1 Tax=Anneissia japonica TaxID=1529436 RepID=UPI0014256ADF